MCTSSDFRLSIRHLDYLLLQLWILLPIPEECVGVASCLPCVGVASCLPPRVGVALCFRCVVLGALDSSHAGGAPWNYCQNAVFCRSYLTGFTVCEKGLEQRLFWDAAWTPQARSWPLALRRCSCARYLLPPIPA